MRNKIVVYYTDGKDVKWYNAYAKEFTEEDDCYKVFGLRNQLVAVFRRELVKIIYTFEEKDDE